MGDVNGLKHVNDTLGHKAGDAYIRAASAMICEIFKHSPVYRIGGDEFAVLMVNVGTLEDDRVCEKIRYINRELAATAADDLPAVSVSVGVAHGASAENWTELFKRADSVLYRVKQDGGRGCRVYSAS